MSSAAGGVRLSLCPDPAQARRRLSRDHRCDARDFYPHYQAPIPSMAVVQLNLDRTQAELTSGYAVPRGTTLDSEPVDGEQCHYQTCFDTTLWPFSVETAELAGRPYEVPVVRSLAGSGGSPFAAGYVCRGGQIQPVPFRLATVFFACRRGTQHLSALRAVVQQHHRNRLGKLAARSQTVGASQTARSRRWGLRGRKRSCRIRRGHSPVTGSYPSSFRFRKSSVRRAERDRLSVPCQRR